MSVDAKSMLRRIAVVCSLSLAFTIGVIVYVDRDIARERRQKEEARAAAARGGSGAGVEMAAQDDSISWGESAGGLRMGLSPARTTIGAQATSVTLTVWYENVGKVVARAPAHNVPGVNAFRLIFLARGPRGADYVTFCVSRDELIPPEIKELNPRERFSESFQFAAPLNFGSVLTSPLPLRLPNIDPGETLTIAAGLTPRIDPRGEADWNDPATLKSGTVTISRRGE